MKDKQQWSPIEEPQAQCQPTINLTEIIDLNIRENYFPKN
jgi:hypothetical protein